MREGGGGTKSSTVSAGLTEARLGFIVAPTGALPRHGLSMNGSRKDLL